MQEACKTKYIQDHKRQLGSEDRFNKRINMGIQGVFYINEGLKIPKI